MGQPAASPYSTPVVLVHGYGGSRANWIPLELVLRRAGFENVHTAGYNWVTATLSAVAEGVRRPATRRWRQQAAARSTWSGTAWGAWWSGMRAAAGTSG